MYYISIIPLQAFGQWQALQRKFLRGRSSQDQAVLHGYQSEASQWWADHHINLNTKDISLDQRDAWCTCCRSVLSRNVSQGQHIVLSQDLGWRWCCYPYQTPSFCLHDSSRNRYVCARVTHVIHCSVLNSTMLGQNLVPTISLLPSLVLTTCISCIAGKHQLSIGGDLYSIDLLAGDTSTHCYAHPTQVQNCKTLCEKQPEVCALCTTLFAWLLPSLFVLIACTISVVLSQLTAPIETCLSIHFIGTAHSKAAEWMSGQGPE